MLKEQDWVRQAMQEAWREAELRKAKAAKRPINPDIVEWAESTFWIPELRGPIELYGYQSAVLREARRKDASGDFVYSTIVWSDIKKSAKSTIAAIVALHTGLSQEWASIYVVANDLKQASSRVGEYLSRAVTQSTQLQERCRLIPSRNLVMIDDLHSKIEFVPIDPSGEAGSNADLIIFSELWGAHHESQKLMWSEMTLSPTKFGRSQRWVETYAGYEGESELLWNLYVQGVKQGRQLTLYDDSGNPIDGLEVYANDAARLLCLWNTKPRLPWQVQAYYAQEASNLLDNEFRRIHRNEWTTSTSVFIDQHLWDMQKSDGIPALKAGEHIVLGVDAAEKQDCFAIVGVSLVPGRDKTVAVRYSRVWRPPKGGKISFRGTEDDPGPITILEQLIKEYYIAPLAYDPAKLELAAQDMAGTVWLYEFSQAGEREEADKLLRDLITQRRIFHDGNHDLREHVIGANAATAGKDKEHIRLIKRGNNHIDAAVALSMACHRILQLNV